MKLKGLAGCVLVLVLAVVLTSSSARAGEGREDCNKDSEHHEHNAKTPVKLVGVIPVPGNPIVSTDIGWVDPGTERFYLADRSNNGVDIIDAEHNFFVARVGGMAGPLPSGGGTSTTNGPGPNGVLVTPNRKLWAGDGNSTAQVADVDPDSPNYLKILHSISTAIPACDGGAEGTHYCGRADELGYDPKDHLILIANNAPRDKNPPHALIAPYATFISADTYQVLSAISFPGAGGLEQPLWDSEIGSFLLTVPGSAPSTLPSVAVISATTRTVQKTYSLDCASSQINGTGFGITGIALAPFQHLLVSACGFPIILNALNGHVINVIRQVGGGDEVWFNSGDGRFYVTAADTKTTVQSLGVIDAETSQWLQNVPDVRGRNPAAFAENNEIFNAVTAPAVTTPPTVEDPNSPCVRSGIVGRGCVAVFAHASEDNQ
jgi:hypothetical protein